ncbi:cytochrome c oxidase subunit II [Alsobacter soli]|uniref:Nitrous-oxide reductase n=1 Tax=Alsobacter soli TaxID=2109933 RepID=A0A2T1HLU8_9HYPH|nr:cytochrome c oxidase subunit II [Alsobacter soli]PSC02623.1 cytochrome c oxidase subunit II [Alsobacter soli]
MRNARRAIVAGSGMAAALLAAPRPACALGWADFPMNYLTTAGVKERPVVALTWGLMGISIAVIVLISLFVLVGVLRRRNTDVSLPEATRIPVVRPRSGLAWISIGVGVSTVVLLGMMGWTAVTMAKIARPPVDPAVTIEIRARQWWWDARYESGDPTRIVDVANEIHIPVGKAVEFKLQSDDVIHSFWIPALGGKTDVIPGQTNMTWLQAERPGVYRGQCAEYCGKQHGHMGIVVVADVPEDFQAWLDGQISPAREAASQQVAEGRDRFIQRCGACHTVRGTRAGGALGPDLTHLMSRGSLAAATLPNKIAYLSGWIANPQTIKPGAQMPNLEISGPELASIRSYLETLK